MTIAEAYSWFDFLVDKADSPYFTDAEKESVFDNAQQSLVNKYVFDYINPARATGSDTKSIESRSEISTILSPLIIEDLQLASSSSGKITRVSIDQAINDAVSESESYMTILSLAKDEAPFLPITKVRHNDYYKLQSNSFKAGSSTNLQYRESRTGITIIPSGAAYYLASVIKYPRKMSGETEFELPELVHDEIVLMALVKSSVATRDQALALLEQNARKDITLLR